MRWDYKLKYKTSQELNCGITVEMKMKYLNTIFVPKFIVKNLSKVEGKWYYYLC